ncbi:hypothetical protein [Zavarzinella formosa]|uniref:hypothetical protein n=1 Tax=Zavarzinella formosa TaxID=360055 RepID=UPI00036DBED8|nr:hypothetical protein [Zavarzinella formosa]
MPANIDPIFARTPDISNNCSTGMNQLVTAAAADYTGSGANNSLIFTADATNGSFVQRIRFKAGGTNVASVARIFLNNGSSNTTATNNCFFGEITLPATTATSAGATIEIDYPLNLALPAGFKIYFGLGTAVSAGWVATVVGGRY